MFATFRAPSSACDILRFLNEWMNGCALMSVRSNTEERERKAISAEEASNIAAALNGDQGAFQRIVERYQSTLAAQLRRFSRDQAVVEDLVHDTFVEAFLSLSSFSGKSPFEHWLRKLAVRTGYRYWKRSARDEKLKDRIREQLSPTSLCSQDPTSAIEASEQLHAMLSKLGPRDRLVLTLLYWEDLSVAEAAELSGWSQSLVKVQAYRARKRLKQLLEENQ